MKSWFTVAFPEYWLFFLGLLFVLVTLFLPRGVVALFDLVRRKPPAEPEPTPAEARPAAAPARVAAAGPSEGRA